MNPIDQILSKLVGHVAEQAGVQVAQSPQIQGAIAEAKNQVARAQTALLWGEIAAALIFVFYFVPRFETPIPRPMRRGRR